MGGAPLASIFLGENRRDDAAKVFHAGAVLLALFGILLTVLLLTLGDPLIRLFGAPDSSFSYASDYLFLYGTGTIFVMFSLGLNPFITAQGYSVTSMLTVTIGAVLNIALDPLFIYAFDLGVRGAALATILSQGVSAIWVTAFFFRKRPLFGFNPNSFSRGQGLFFAFSCWGFRPLS